MSSQGPYQIRLNPMGAAPARVPRNTEADRDTLRAIQAAARAGDLPRAMTLSETALAAGLEHPMILNLVAASLENRGRLEEARTFLLRALELAPGDLGVLNALGIGTLRLERYSEALGHFDAALATLPAFAPGHANRGAALLALGRVAEAEAAFDKALSLNPGHLSALSGKAAIAGRRGDHQAARSLGDQVLRAEPNHPDSSMTVAAAELALGDPDAAEGRLKALIQDPRLVPLDLALAEGLLADVFDSVGRTDDAFVTYTRSNDRLRRHYAPRFGVGESAIEATRRIAAYVEDSPPPVRTATAPDARQPVFLLGFPRSGTTLLEAVLGGHPDVETLEERETLVDATPAFLVESGGLDRLGRASDSELAPFREAYWRRVREAGGRLDRAVFIDKHPFHTLRLPLIARLFPGARILVSRRDPRDVVLSCFRRRFQMSANGYSLLSLEDVARFYAEAMRLEAAVGHWAPLNRRIVKHERLVTAFEPEIAETLEFLNLRPAPLGDVAERARSGAIATPSGAQIARGVTAEGLGQWRRYREPLAAVAPILSPWIERFGYEPE